ncbi:DUF1156 domain-containing protein [Candidatus Palauibacter sp.]|uniref:DUF1156 domain-containing protein n=1 Tax=Candidatus Palauibacter sp. TaxID=3101350 RepID=UPI003B012761
MSRTKTLIEEWFPIETIGSESMRDQSAAQKPPLNRLHVWWARRPLTASRAVMLASVLPAWSPELARFLKKRESENFRSAEEYHQWFVRLCGIYGDPVEGRRKIQWAKARNIKLKDPPYTHKRAFTVNPTEAQLSLLSELLEYAWNKPQLRVHDSFAGGGSIPFEALRYGFDAEANELNAVACTTLRATLDYPFAFGPSLERDIRQWGMQLTGTLRTRLQSFFPKQPDGSVHAYIWARTVACPYTGKPIPLAPNWWLFRSGSKGFVAHPLFDPDAPEARFEIMRMERIEQEGFDPNDGTVRGGKGRSPWAHGQAVDAGYIQAEAQAGRMGSQLYCVAIKKASGGFDFRPPTDAEAEAVMRAETELRKNLPKWEAQGLVPVEFIPPGHKSDELLRFGMQTWRDVFSPRQLLSLCSYLEALHELSPKMQQELPADRAKAVATYLGLALSKAINYNAYLASWHVTRAVVRSVFDQHNYSFKWSYGEFDASRNLFPWALDQVCGAYKGIAALGAPAHRMLEQMEAPVPVQVTQGSASDLKHIPDGGVDLVLTDPPYYGNVMYGELSDFFYVWLKRALGDVHPDLFADELVNKDEEAVANPARFASFKRKKKQLAHADYERKMAAAFREAHRVLSDNGVLTVMFTHKKVEAWDTLATSLLNSGFAIRSSWPVHTESDHSLHQAKKNAAKSTIMLTCRKRPAGAEPAWWDDLRGRVGRTARETAERLQAQGISGVDLYISTFGPTLAILSEHWPVLTSEVDESTGEPKPLQPDVALDLARTEVVELRKRGLLGRDTRFDPPTDWYLMAWDAFKAAEFPADEARKLALALGLDLDADLIAGNRLLARKGATVQLLSPARRRGRGRVDPDADPFAAWIDAAHTAMLLYDDEGPRSADVFLTRNGFLRDATFRALVAALVQAVPRVRKKGEFVRPEARSLEQLRLAFFEDIDAPPDPDPEIGQASLGL